MTESKKNSMIPTPLRAPIALALAWIVPGAGHVFVGRPMRGLIIFLVIGALFWGGIAMGGVMTMDHEGQKWWFIAEMFTGGHGLIGWQREKNCIKNYEADIRKEMANEAASCRAQIRSFREHLTQCEEDLAQANADLKRATTAQQQQRLTEEIERLLKNQKGYAQNIAISKRKLSTTRNAYVESELSKKKLALVAPMATIARAYAGVAGLLNLMCAFDVFMLALLGPAAAAEPKRGEDE
ncbi:MAG: hypothetical protein HN350_03190 [Phycisphaerales bacterium]|jgi:hypothetical protein|nr:hypothetical protein [Phycisphaerales bacterium]